MVDGMVRPSDAVDRLSLAEQVAEKLSASILSGDYRPGARLPEIELAERFNVSRVPVREALRLLAHQGLVQFRPRRGAIVPEVEASDIRDLYDVRAALLS
ncbi:MAG: GntR family transcriptional regulator, partial [Pseudomonadota bacterium]